MLFLTLLTLTDLCLERHFAKTEWTVGPLGGVARCAAQFTKYRR